MFSVVGGCHAAETNQNRTRAQEEKGAVKDVEGEKQETKEKQGPINFFGRVFLSFNILIRDVTIVNFRINV